jgi:hypothetical protein
MPIYQGFILTIEGYDALNSHPSLLANLDRHIQRILATLH